MSAELSHDPLRDEVSTVQQGIAPISPILALIEDLNEACIRYCHWKSNIRLRETLEGADDVDLLVDFRHAGRFEALLLRHGFKFAHSRAGIGHPGVFHALALDEDRAELVHVHAYFQIVSGDSLVKNYRLPVEEMLLEQRVKREGVWIPAPEVELILFAIRLALKHTNPVEVWMASRDSAVQRDEMAWLAGQADITQASALCRQTFPQIDPAMFLDIVDTFSASSSPLWKRLLLGLRLARQLRGLRRLEPLAAAASLAWRVSAMGWGRVRKRRDLSLQTGGAIIALVGPKATGKSTLGRALTTRLGRHLAIRQIHSGKPPPTWLSAGPRLLTPILRALVPAERPGEYEKPERRGERSYSMLYVLRMALLAYDRKRLLLSAFRSAAAGTIVLSDRYPSSAEMTMDGSCFDDLAVEKCNSRIKRYLMVKERALYTAMPKPRLVIRLTAPIEKAIDRDAHRTKSGGPDAEAVRRRRELETRAVIEAAGHVDVSTEGDLDATVRLVVKLAWDTL